MNSRNAVMASTEELSPGADEADSPSEIEPHNRMNTKTYRISEANLSAPEGVVILMEFPVVGRHEVLLSEAAAYLKATQGVIGRMPTRVSLTDGRKVGAFACIVAKTELAAEALGHMVGYDIAVGDGVRCATQLQAREYFLCLNRRYGIPTKNLECKWMISPPEPTGNEPKQRSLFTQEQRDAALADSPF